MIDVLKYHHDDYDVIIRTDSIDSCWKRFKGRINYRNQWAEKPAAVDTYCQYYCDKDCHMALVEPNGVGLWQDITPQDKYWPVIYETNKYQITIQLKDIDHIQPQVNHVRRDVEAFFSFDWEGHDKDSKASAKYGVFNGTVEFTNEPGLFRLGFTYTKNGLVKQASIAFDVVSPKLDVKNDYQSILNEVNREFEEYLFRYLSLTVQSLRKGTQRSTEIWMQVFQEVVDDYIKNVERIIKNPHSKVRTQVLHAHADRIKRWSPQMEEEFAEKEEDGKLEEYYFRYKEYENTVNSMENRFVKYTLHSIGSDLKEVFNTVLQRNNTEVSDSYREKWKGYQEKINHLIKNPFFQAVGRFEGMRQESLVLQSRMGYQQIYKNWLKLRRGIDFYNGAINIGTLQIWEIYELWCFIKIKKIVLDVLGLDPLSSLIHEPETPLVHYNNYKGKNETDYHITIDYPQVKEDLVPSKQEDLQFVNQLQLHQGDSVSIHYQHTFSRLRSDNDEVRTWTTEQRPDIILNIHHKGTILTYLYDAKYRVWSDSKLDREQDNVLQLDDSEQEQINQFLGADYPPADALNQMHRYRDAIYYGMADNDRPHSKEIIGGYILFPGRGDDATIANRFYSKSIEQVNIGAFPLLPCGGKRQDNLDVDGPQLHAHLRKILLENESSYSHVENAIPQRGLAYVDSTDKAAEKLTIVVRVGTEEQLDWVRQNKWYNIPIQKVTNAPQILKARQMIFLLNNNVVAKTNIVKNRIDVWTKERLWETEGYYKEPSSENYFMIRLHDLEDYSISIQELNSHIVESNVKEPYYFVTI